MFLRAFVVVAFLACLAVATGCSGASQAPTTPPMGDVAAQSGSEVPPSLTPQASHVLWGMWEVTVDSETRTAEIVPLRGAMFNANVTRFLQPPLSPINLITIAVNPGSDFLTGHLDLGVTLRHPFTGYAKFRGFDVRGIVMGDGNVPFAFDSAVFRAGPADLMLENADGWTRWWNPTEFTSFDKIFGYTHGVKAPSGYYAVATVNPYKYFADGLEEDTGLDELDLSTRGTYSVDPGVNTRRYVIQFPVDPLSGKPLFKFNYAIDASWALPDEDYAPLYPVEAYPPQANQQEAWRMRIDDEGSTAWYVDEDANGGMLNLSVEVFDWQAMLQESTVADEVSQIWVECPILPSPTEITLLTDPIPSGVCSSVWSPELGDLDLTSAGEFECWVGVVASQPENYAPQIDADPGMFDWPDAPLTAYGRGTVSVLDTYPTDAPQVLQVIPSYGVVSTVVEDVQILGDFFQDGATVDFDFDLVTSLELLNVAWVDENLITCDVNCAGPLGFYDVTVTNPDTQYGTLEDGFEVIEEFKCEGSAHDWVGEHEIAGLVYDPDSHRYDMALLTQGSRAGMAIHQMNSTEWGVIDPAGGAGQTIEPFMTTPYCCTVDVETDETNGVIAIINLYSDEKVLLFHAEGNTLGDLSDPTLDGNFTAIDFDRKGDLWAVVRTGDSGIPANWQFEIRHYAVGEDDPLYILVPEDTVNINDTALIGPVGHRHIGDIGISFYLHRLYVFTANTYDGGSNRITGWDLSVSPPSLVCERDNPFPPLTRHHIFSQGALSRMNIDVDHRFPDDPYEQCRIYAYASIWTEGPPAKGLDHWVIRLDGELNTLDQGSVFHIPWPLAWDDIPQCCVINDLAPDGEANLFGCGWNGTDFCEWSTPPDW